MTIRQPPDKDKRSLERFAKAYAAGKEDGRREVQCRAGGATITVELTLGEYLRLHWQRKYGSASQAAAALGVSAAFLSVVAAGKKRPTKQILEDAQLKVETTITRSQEISLVGMKQTHPRPSGGCPSCGNTTFGMHNEHCSEFSKYPLHKRRRTQERSRKNGAL